jgi:hypothetical protein
MTDLNATSGDFDLEYRDVVADSSVPTSAPLTSIPDQYKNKGIEDLIKMHMNAQNLIQRQGRDLGDMRRIVDAQTQLIGQRQSPEQTRPVEQPKREPITAEALLSNPEAAITRAVQPALEQTARRVESIEKSQQQRDFEDKYPDYRNDVQKQEFQDWTLKSGLRSKLLMDLHQKYDFVSGTQLWELWTEHKQAQNAVETARQGRVTAMTTVKQTPTDTASMVGKPIYSRAKLAELQLKAIAGDPGASARWNDPEFQREYMLAYSEDRVR